MDAVTISQSAICPTKHNTAQYLHLPFDTSPELYNTSHLSAHRHTLQIDDSQHTFSPVPGLFKTPPLHDSIITLPFASGRRFSALALRASFAGF